ncbi:hypothetical protein BIW11_02476 [Tropilaelaps mercedesae]|uniref:Uncharacterized protein n=1 Tax=Tropilaelaps mercedesae TaxID=418985 RepID=A0A1V9Y2L3_9ACAR|nr:hypothetical protein BIW11_02476 [Tropilaelaps mercedesae]
MFTILQKVKVESTAPKLLWMMQGNCQKSGQFHYINLFGVVGRGQHLQRETALVSRLNATPSKGHRRYRPREKKPASFVQKIADGHEQHQAITGSSLYVIRHSTSALDPN